MSAIALPAVPAAAQYIGGAAPPPDAPLPGDGRDARSARWRATSALLALTPRNFKALIGAGRAALALGDTQAAVGFFGRAEEVSPRSRRRRSAWARRRVAMGDAAGRARFLRPAPSGLARPRCSIARRSRPRLRPDRRPADGAVGLSRRARRARSGRGAPPAGAEPRHLAATGRRRRDASSRCWQRRDPAARRIRAFVLALVGDARRRAAAIDAAMPGAGSRYRALLPDAAGAARRPESGGGPPRHLPETPAAALRPGRAGASLAGRRRSATLASPPGRDAAASAAQQPVQGRRRAAPGGPGRAASAGPYLASVRPSLDPSRYASTRRPNAAADSGEHGGSRAMPTRSPDPPVASMTIAKLLHETDSDDAGRDRCRRPRRPPPSRTPAPRAGVRRRSGFEAQASTPHGRRPRSRSPRSRPPRRPPRARRRRPTLGRREEGQGRSRQAGRRRHQLGPARRRLEPGPHGGRISAARRQGAASCSGRAPAMSPTARIISGC